MEKKKEKLAKLETEYKDIGIKLQKVSLDILEFERTEQYNEYKTFDEEQKKEKYGEKYSLYEQRDKAKNDLEEAYAKVLEAATEYNQELGTSVEDKEAEVQANKKQLKNLQARIKRQLNKIEALKQTEEYKNGDKVMLLKVEEQEAELHLKLDNKQEITDKIQALKKDIDDLKLEKEDLVALYGKEIEKQPEKAKPEPEKTKKVEPQNAKPEVKEENSKPEPEQEKKTKPQQKPNQQGNYSNNSYAWQPIYTVTSAPVARVESPAEKAKREAEEQLKSDFKELYSKAKHGKFTEKDFDKMVEIMKDPENYDKLGITTGIVFNKAKVIFKAMGKAVSIKDFTAKNASERLTDELTKAEKIVEEDRETLSEEQKAEWDNANKHIGQYNALKDTIKVYDDVSNKRMQAKWSWLFEFENEQKPALPENTEPKPQEKKNDFADKLAEQTKLEPDYENVKVSERQKDEQVQAK